MGHSQVYEGQLSKFTNVVKGWQYRWFVLTPESGTLGYHLLNDDSSVGKIRGTQHLAGTVVVPSEEDSQTFNVNFASGEAYKLRASNVRERQVWVDRIRAVAQRFDTAIAHNAPIMPLREYMTPPPGSKSQLTSNGEPTEALQHLSLSVLDAFGSVHDILHQSDLKHVALSRSIESLPFNTSHDMDCHDQLLLMLKASSQSALLSMESALSILQDLRDLNQQQQHRHQTVAKSPHKKSSSTFFNNISTTNSVSGSPTRMSNELSFSQLQQQADTLSIKSAHVGSLGCGEKNTSLLSPVKIDSMHSNLSASSPSINKDCSAVAGEGQEQQHNQQKKPEDS